MPVDISAYNVANQKQYVETQAQQAEIQKEKLAARTGLSSGELAYLQSKGINPDKIISMESQGYSKNAIFYLAEQGKTPLLSRQAIGTLNDIIEGKTVRFQAGEYDSDRGTYSGYNNKYVLFELGKVLDIPIGRSQNITFSEGRLTTSSSTKEILTYAPGEAGAKQREMDIQIALSAERRAALPQIEEQEKKAGPEYQVQYKEGQIITTKKPEFAIKEISAPTGKEIQVVLGTGETKGYSQLPPSLQAEVRGLIAPKLAEANVETAKFYGVSGSFFELNPKTGVFEDTGLGKEIQINPAKFGLSPTTIFTKEGGKTLTGPAWVKYEYPNISEKIDVMIANRAPEYKVSLKSAPLSLIPQEDLLSSFRTQYGKLIASGENLLTKTLGIPGSATAERTIKEMQVSPYEQPGLFLLLRGDFGKYPAQQVYAQKGGMVGEMITLSPFATGRKIYPAIVPISQSSVESLRENMGFVFAVENVASDIGFESFVSGVGTYIGGIKLAQGIYETLYPTRTIKGNGLDLSNLDIVEVGKPREGISPKFGEAGKALLEPTIFIASLIIPSKIAKVAATGTGIAAKAASLLLPALVGTGFTLETLRSAGGGPIEKKDIIRGLGYGAGILLTWKGLEFGAQKGYEFFEGRTDKGLMEIARNVFVSERFMNVKDYYAEVGGDEVKINKAIASTEKYMKSMTESQMDEFQGLKTQKFKLEEMPTNKKTGLDFSKPIQLNVELFGVNKLYPREGFYAEATLFGKYQVYYLKTGLGIGEGLKLEPIEPIEPKLGSISEPTSGVPKETENIIPQQKTAEMNVFHIKEPQEPLKNMISLEFTKPEIPRIKIEEEMAEIDYMEKGIQQKKLTKSERLRIEREIRFAQSQKARLGTAQNLRLATAQNLRLAEAQNVRLAVAQNLRLATAQNLRLAEAQNVRLAIAQNLRLASAQNLRLAQAQNVRLALIQIPDIKGKTKKSKLNLRIKPSKQLVQVRTAYAGLANIFESEVKYGKATNPLFTKHPEKLGYFNVPTLEQIKSRRFKKVRRGVGL